MPKTLLTFLKILLSVIAALILNGCGLAPPLTTDLEEYTSRLARVLDSSFPDVGSDTTLPYPSRQTLFNPLEEAEITLPDFYSIQSCELGTLVAERNTTLGKQQDAAASWVYESALVTALENCVRKLKQTDENPSLANRLDGLRAMKATQLQKVWANLIQTSTETRLAFSQSKELITADSNRDAESGINALAWLTTLPDAGNVTSEQINGQLKILESSRIPAKVWKSQKVFSAHLSALNRILPAPLADINCDNGKASEEAEILRNVFYLFFIERIQPAGSQLNQYMYKLQPTLNALQASPYLSEAFKDYLTERELEFRQYREVMAEHIGLWQHFLGRCNLSPQAG